jgi:hypothetical protein
MFRPIEVFPDLISRLIEAVADELAGFRQRTTRSGVFLTGSVLANPSGSVPEGLPFC